MKMFFIAITVIVIAASTSGCIGLPSTAGRAAATTPTVKLGQVDIYCPTVNAQALQSYNTAVQLFYQGKLDDAKKLYLKAIELDPGFCDAMDNVGLIFRRQGDLEQAVFWYKKSIGVFPNNSTAHQNLAVTYQLQAKTNDAIAEYKLLLQINPDDPEGYYGLGVILRNQEQFQDAIAQLSKAEELYVAQSSPWVSDARYELGIAYFFQKDYRHARDYLEKAYSALKDKAELNYYLGLCYLSPDLKDIELARKYMNRAKELGVQIPSDVLQQLNP